MAKTANDLRELFSSLDTRTNGYKKLNPPGQRPASVLVPLFYHDDEWYVWLTLRAKHLSSHAGLVAFPGGHADDLDTDEVVTALREAEEEIGLSPEVVEVVAVLPQSPVRPNKIVTPVVGVIPPDFKPCINEHEVEKAFHLPLSRFLRDDVVKEDVEFLSGIVHVYYFTDVIDDVSVVTWGFTAVYCMDVALVVYQSDKTFIHRDGSVVSLNNVFDPIATQEYLTKLYGMVASTSKM